jgi:hypothetical protein
VNALLALGWPNHQFHRAVVARLERSPKPRWATCALTQLAFVRLSSNPAIVGVPKTPREALDLLTALVGDSGHVFITPLPSVPEASAHFRHPIRHQQITDAYLLAVAQAAAARLLTLDRRILPPASALALVEVLAPI